ncbi:MAG TPA: N-acetyltransferase [Gemmatimonadaceae bacterium]|nr:N-acetyltransferase [Gemmatimonadaceae bacterium]
MRRAGIHRLSLADLDALLELQHQSLPDTLSARLGPSFNVLYHRTMFGEPLYLCDGYFADDVLVGYLSYTPSTVRLLRSALRHHAFAFAATLFWSILPSRQRWRLAARIARSVLVPRSEPAPDVSAELLSIAVRPEYRGRKLPERGTVGSLLLRNALSTLRESGAASVKACVTPGDPLANAFYRKHGFQFLHSIERYGLHANLYVRDLTESASVQPA